MKTSETDVSKVPSREVFDYELTLRFRVSTYDKPINPKLATHLNNLFAKWSDGRHEINAEMLCHALADCMEEAAYYSCIEEAVELIGENVMVDDGCCGTVNKAYVEGRNMFFSRLAAGELAHLWSEPFATIERKDNVKHS